MINYLDALIVIMFVSCLFAVIMTFLVTGDLKQFYNKIIEKWNTLKDYLIFRSET